MDNFKAVYKILTVLEKAMDLPEFDTGQIGAEVLGVSSQRWGRYIEMMADVGYIKGVSVSEYIDGSLFVDVRNIRITLKGLEYLQENAIMRKIYNMTKGIKDIVPGM
ncbi:MAG: YjcQ family protein [Clostridia bacterium]|nr:YjcQ family protein [Clostridia bacterium]